MYLHAQLPIPAFLPHIYNWWLLLAHTIYSMGILDFLTNEQREIQQGYIVEIWKKRMDRD